MALHDIHYHSIVYLFYENAALHWRATFSSREDYNSAKAGLEIFHTNPSFHTIGIVWNLGMTQESPSPNRVGSQHFACNHWHKMAMWVQHWRLSLDASRLSSSSFWPPSWCPYLHLEITMYRKVPNKRAGRGSKKRTQSLVWSQWNSQPGPMNTLRICPENLIEFG